MSVRIMGHHVSAVLHHRFGIPTYKDSERLCRFAASPGVGPRATVGTLRTGYPHVQASSKDNSSCLPTRGSFGAATCLRGSGSRLST
jgi:hypothetical protein